ncbi:aldo/keto reductase [Streptomyces sp. NPDC101234]|uniref:aldo/keto reductase n=1 Tax=Streptomyces sp. NPDC101234 TaxID=3366138 RepID=UPI0038056FD9
MWSTDHCRHNPAVPPQALRSFDARWQPGNFEQNVEAVNRLADLTVGKGITVARLALAWLLSRGEQVVPILGTRSPKRVEGNAAVADVTLTGADLTAIDEILPHGGFGARYPEGHVPSWTRRSPRGLSRPLPRTPPGPLPAGPGGTAHLAPERGASPSPPAATAWSWVPLSTLDLLEHRVDSAGGKEDQTRRGRRHEDAECCPEPQVGRLAQPQRIARRQRPHRDGLSGEYGVLLARGGVALRPGRVQWPGLARPWTRPGRIALGPRTQRPTPWPLPAAASRPSRPVMSVSITSRNMWS